MFEWIDPWETMDRFEYEWRAREDEHRAEMCAAALAFADASYQLQKRMDAAWDPIARAKALQPQPPIILRKGDV